MRLLALLALGLVSCSDGGDDDTVLVPNPLTNPDDGPPAGNLDGACDVPAEAGLADSSSPTTVVGDGSPASCTGDAFIAAVGLTDDMDRPLTEATWSPSTADRSRW